MRALVRVAGALLCVCLVASTSAVAAPRLHRTKLPPPLPLPTSLAVDEGEWVVVPSKTAVAAGDVTLRVYNRGMDDHDLTLVDATGTAQQVALAPGGTSTLRVTLTPGTWKLYCSLFAGTPSSHEALGMSALLTARRDPALRTRAVR